MARWLGGGNGSLRLRVRLGDSGWLAVLRDAKLTVLEGEIALSCLCLSVLSCVRSVMMIGVVGRVGLEPRLDCRAEIGMGDGLVEVRCDREPAFVFCGFLRAWKKIFSPLWFFGIECLVEEQGMWADVKLYRATGHLREIRRYCRVESGMKLGREQCAQSGMIGAKGVDK